MHTTKTFVKKIQIASVLFGAVFFFGLSISNVHAITLSPARVEVAGEPGETVVFKTTVINELAAPAVLYSSFANFEAQGDSGTPALSEATDDLGTWMTVPDSLSLSPGGSQDVDIKLVIPKDATPGGHFAAVFWGNQPKKLVPGQVGIGAKTGILILLTVKGDIPEDGGVTIFDTVGGKRFFSALPISFYYRFQNGGGDRILPSGDVVIKNTIGITSKRIPGNPVEGNILPRSTRKFTTHWVGRDGDTGVVPSGFFAAANYQFHNFAFGKYSAHLKLTYGSKGLITDSVVRVFVFPWQLLVLVIVILTAIFFGIKTALYHYNKWVIGKAEAMLEEIEEREEQEDIAAGRPVQHHFHHHDTHPDEHSK